ncbi:MAG: HAD family hydrolase [Clostridia bacterium]|nr:HAD family hydrolase [Clostridia bacterium]
MIKIEIPGRDEPLELRYLVLDYNGTIACDGKLLEDAAQAIEKLKDNLEIYILTADTYGNVRKECEKTGAKIETFAHAGAGVCKEETVKRLGKGVCAFGNGFNDIAMFDAADFSVCIIGEEGAYSGAISHADIVVTSAKDAFNLLLKPDRIRAGLRN